MHNSLHYLLMVNQATIQKRLFNSLKDTELSLGQPKILDYLKENTATEDRYMSS